MEELRADALALEDAGCFAIVLEGVPRELARVVTEELRIPTIGIGAGPDCDGQVLVLHDMMTMTFSPPAKFVRRYADVAGVMREALGEYKQDVEARRSLPMRRATISRRRCGERDGEPWLGRVG